MPSKSTLWLHCAKWEEYISNINIACCDLMWSANAIASMDPSTPQQCITTFVCSCDVMSFPFTNSMLVKMLTWRRYCGLLFKREGTFDRFVCEWALIIQDVPDFDAKFVVSYIIPIIPCSGNRVKYILTTLPA